MPRVQDAIPSLDCRAWKGRSNPLLLSALRFAPESRPEHPPPCFPTPTRASRYPRPSKRNPSTSGNSVKGLSEGRGVACRLTGDIAMLYMLVADENPKREAQRAK